MRQFSCSPLSTRADFFAFGCSCDLKADNPSDSALVDLLIDQASDMLCLLSGGRVFGRCLATVRPLRDGGNCYVPYGGTFVESGFDYRSIRAPFGGADVIPLRGPETDIVEVKIDGVALATSAYRLINHRYLARTDGGSWPSSNDLVKPYGSVGVFTIMHRFGLVPDAITKDAVDELVCELALDATGRKSGLPPGVRAANIQGASVSIESTAAALVEGHENLQSIARFLGVYNPTENRASSGIWSPELDLGWELFDSAGPSDS